MIGSTPGRNDADFLRVRNDADAALNVELLEASEAQQTIDGDL
jgi:hypothetical protein